MGDGPGNLALQKRTGPGSLCRLWIDRRAGLVGRACSATWWAALTLRLPPDLDLGGPRSHPPAPRLCDDWGFLNKRQRDAHGIPGANGGGGVWPSPPAEAA